MVMAVDSSLVKPDTAEAGIPAAFQNTKTLKPYGSVSIGRVSGDWQTPEGKPIGIGRYPSGITAEKGCFIKKQCQGADSRFKGNQGVAGLPLLNITPYRFLHTLHHRHLCAWHIEPFTRLSIRSSMSLCMVAGSTI